MPILYHVDGHNGTNVRKRWRRGRSSAPLFAGPKGFVFETMFRAYGESTHGGWVEYAMHIPASLYTESMRPRTKKVVRVTKRNIEKYRAFVNKVLATTPKGTKLGFNRAMMRPEHRNILGFDLTRVSARYQRKRDKGTMGAEGWFYEIPKEIKFTVYRVFSCETCRENSEYGSDDESARGGAGRCDDCREYFECGSGDERARGGARSGARCGTGR